MHIGQICTVRWQISEGSDTFLWHKAMIKSIEGDTITVIWQEDSWKGQESDRIPLDWVIVRDDLKSVRQDITEVKNLVLSHIQVDNTRWEQCFEGIRHMNQKSNGIAELLTHNMEVADAGIRHMTELSDNREKKIVEAKLDNRIVRR